MNFPVPSIINATLAEALSAGCDCVMLKHDGLPITINCVKGVGNIFTDFKFHIGPTQEYLGQVNAIEPVDALLIGLKNRGPEVTRVILYDTWWMDGQDIQHLTYRERFVLTRCNAKKFDSRFETALVMPIGGAPALWRQVMAEPEKYKGLVYRRSKDTAAGEMYVTRYYAESPMELV